MKEILETTRLESPNSTFLIDLIKHPNGHLYIEMNQIIDNTNEKSKPLKINPLILSDLIQTLQMYHALISVRYPLDVKHMVDADQHKIQKDYLKGISIDNLALNFGQPKELIESILRNKGIQIVSTKLPKRYK